MPNSATGFSPEELLINRLLKTCLDRIHLHFSEPNPKDPSNSILRMFAPVNLVYTRGFHPQDEWIPARITEVSPTMYEVLTDEGLV